MIYQCNQKKELLFTKSLQKNDSLSLKKTSYLIYNYLNVLIFDLDLENNNEMKNLFKNTLFKYLHNSGQEYSIYSMHF